MLKQIFQPRFCETDALGHISNTTLPIWFETAREPIFRWFSPDLDPSDWHLILGRMSYEFERELFYQHPVEVRTFISRIGNSSFEVYHEAWQSGQRCVTGSVTLVHFDYQSKKAKPLPGAVRELMQAQLLETV